ncbi:MAG: hypothetical protein Q7S63_02735 [bacterium]|nr:hypothetical protein [bacterium]
MDWRHCDMVIRYKSERLRSPVSRVSLGDGVEAETRPVLSLVPCALASDLSVDEAIRKIQAYIHTQNSELEEEEFEVEYGFPGHPMTEDPREESILFVTPAGCRLGSPLFQALS